MPLDTRQPRCLPTGIDPRIFCEDIASPGSALPGFPVMKLEKPYYEAEPKPHSSSPSFKGLFPSKNQYFEEKQSPFVDGLSGIAATPHAAFGSSQKRLLIFDHSENQTRLLHCSLFSPYHPSTVVAKPVRTSDEFDVEKLLKMDHFMPDKFLSPEDFDENLVNGEESEMHEDTEEINALLYSDEDDDCGDSDDEVLSTGHSPFPVEEFCHRNELKQMVEETDTGAGPRKRQKLTAGGYDKSSHMDTARTAKFEDLSHKYENIVHGSSHASEQEMGSGLSNKQSREDKIRTALRILECIVPGTEGKEAMSVLDEAIDYLKLLKQNAKILGVNYC